ncbi:HAAS signaling domain-containing protein [Kitasatospora sp. NBC_00458]|uniref:HAAS signaling domain-containing protein n=1 Tax=Kitasatospora sp. NBC_00458 TaxID=2903568 RepID=UPI002E17F7D3
MNNPMDDPMEHPLVRAYLDTVTRRTAALPGERRRELLADLREHVEVALAEHGSADENALREVLDRLGRPEEVAGAALAEEGRARPEPENAGRTALTLSLALAPLPLLVVPAVGPVLAVAAAVAALVRIRKSPQWERREKKQAILLLLSPVLVTPLIAVLLSIASGGLDPLTLLAACLAGVLLPVLAVLRLARSASRLRADAGGVTVTA